MASKKVLLIDDDQDLRVIYGNALTKDGYLVTSCKDGEEGLSYAKKGGFDLILMDIMMPKVDGISVLTELRNSPSETPNGPIVMMTNLSNKETIEEVLANGAKGWILKTDYTPSEAIQKVNSIAFGNQPQSLTS